MMVNRPTAAASTESPPDPLLGRVINEKFKILGFIARGGMGRVYRAEQTPLGRICAIKVLNPNYTGEHDPGFHRRFFLEASMTSKLRHPNTVTIFDYGSTDDGVYYMAMEYLEGYTLHRAIRQVGHLPEERTAHIARQICRALREAHSLGVVHRDLKPANVYLLELGDEPDFVKVLDFGLVKDVTSGSEDLTKAGLFMGSPKYMAPEQINGAPIDGRTDVYALGVIMYEMVTGKVPFDRPKSLDVLIAHVNEEVPPIHQTNPAARISPALEEVIMRSVAKDPNDRFRSMDEVLGALKRLGGAGAPEASMTIERRSLTSRGPMASRILLGTGAAMAVPVQDHAADESAAAPASDRSPSSAAQDTSEPDGPVRRSKPHRLVVALVGTLAVAGGIAYEHLPAPADDGDTSAATATAGAVIPTPPTAALSSPEIVPGDPVTAKPRKSAAEVDVSARSPVVVPTTLAGSAPSAAVPAPIVGNPSGSKPQAPRRPVGPAPPTAKATVDCNPSYYYDADGNKHFKPECFGR
jgi:eukaryotic-like serine/threonine-protein kinase